MTDLQKFIIKEMESLQKGEFASIQPLMEIPEDQRISENAEKSEKIGHIIEYVEKTDGVTLEDLDRIVRWTKILEPYKPQD